MEKGLISQTWLVAYHLNNVNLLNAKCMEHICGLSVDALTDCLLKIEDENILEKPEHMLMRVAIALHGDDMDLVLNTYSTMSKGCYILSPILLRNANKLVMEDVHCSYTVSMPHDSIDGIFASVKECLHLLNAGSDIALNLHSIRPIGSYVAGSNSYSNGIVPLLRVFNSTIDFMLNARISISMEPWHPEILEFLNLCKKSGIAESRARDLKLAVWIPDLFMKRVEADADWSLMCPKECPGLFDAWGMEFELLYLEYEGSGRFVKRVNARDLWLAIYEAELDYGSLSLLYKDTCNRKSGQHHLGTITNGSFQGDIIQYSSNANLGKCDSGAISLNSFVHADGSFDFQKLHNVTKLITRNLNAYIDHCGSTKNDHRAIAIGVHGLADTFISMRLPYDCDKAKSLNKQIFETIYFGALEASCELAKKFGTYASYPNSSASKGILQYDLWNVTPSDLWNWSELKDHISQHGLRNSQLIAINPSLEISDILMASKSTGPIQSLVNDNYDQHIYPQLIEDLTNLNQWNDDIKLQILNNNPEKFKNICPTLSELYKTVWEIRVKPIMDMAADRGPFIDQSESFNIYANHIAYGQMSSMHFYSWRMGLKTGVHHLYINTASKGLAHIKQVKFLTPSKPIENISVQIPKSKEMLVTKRGKSFFIYLKIIFFWDYD